MLAAKAPDAESPPANQCGLRRNPMHQPCRTRLPWMAIGVRSRTNRLATLDASLPSRRRPGKRAGAMDGYRSEVANESTCDAGCVASFPAEAGQASRGHGWLSERGRERIDLRRWMRRFLPGGGRASEPGPWMAIGARSRTNRLATLDASLPSRRRPGKRAGAMDGPASV